ncbi:MAG: fibrobacter succinogenes major paralogous domain-containing protein [Bacteroidales bacterium]|nr:fibrobacter succinogenes major paralogous domain-containing protein [Bacteroidales bacterium]
METRRKRKDIASSLETRRSKSHIAHRISQILLLALSLASASAQDVAWKKNFGGIGADFYNAVTAVSDGVVAGGYSYASSFGTGDWVDVTGKGSIAYDATIVKYNLNGDALWRKNFGGSSTDIYYAITTVSDGIVAAGYSYLDSFGNGDWTGVTGQGYYDAIIVKYDNNGDVVWKKNFGGSGEDRYNAVTAVSDGIVAAGYSQPDSFGNGDWTGVTGKGDVDAIIVKYDNDGNVVWKKNFGGSDRDYYNAVMAVSDGVVAVGYSYSGSFGNGDWAGFTGNGYMDAVIVKYNNSGDVVWKKNFGGSSDDRYDGVTVAFDGVVAVGRSAVGSFGNGDWTGVTGQGYYDAIIVKYDNDGYVLWKKNFGGSSADYYYGVTIVSDGVVAVGHSYIDSFGNGDWMGVTGKGDMDAIIVKYDNDGNVVWKKNLGGSNEDIYNAVTAVADGVVAAGYATEFGTGDWAGITGKGGWDAIIVGYFPPSSPSAAVATHADFSCPGEVVVTYDLVSDLPVDVTLYYSPNQCDWLEAISVTGDLFDQTTGTGKTITWYNYNDNVRYGKFFFKVEAPDQSCVPDCVMINGVCWATRNLDVGGGFVASPQEYGAYFQWGRKSDGHEDLDSPCWPLSPPCGDNADGAVSVLDGDGQVPCPGAPCGYFIRQATSPYDWRTPQDPALWNAGTENAPEKTVNDPCPCGWRVPTHAEFQSLANTAYVAHDWDYTLGGYHFIDNATGNTIFLPVAGVRSHYNGNLSSAGTSGYYWSSSVTGTSASFLYISYGAVYPTNSSGRTSGFSIRCVAE